LMKQCRSETGHVKRNTFGLCGYGENQLGPFTLEGQLTLVAPDKMKEHDGVKNIKKVKAAKFELTKTYTGKVIEELVDEVRFVPDLDEVRFVPDLDEVMMQRDSR